MPDFPDYSTIPDLTRFHVMGTYVFVDNIAIGPANSKALVAASVSHLHASERYDLERAAHPADSAEAEIAAAKSVTEHWWGVTCALAAGQLVTGAISVAEPTKLSADLDPYTNGLSTTGFVTTDMVNMPPLDDEDFDAFAGGE